MRSRKTLCVLLLVATTLLTLSIAAATALAGESERVIYSFGDRVGFAPSGLVIDAAGNLYGTTSAEVLVSPCTGTNPRCGTVFELSRGPDGGWVESDLLSFDGNDGSTPYGSLTIDSAGNLYGTTQYGGPGPCWGYIRLGCGVVFELTPSSAGGWTEKVLYIFVGSNGAYPVGSLTLDAAGNIYGAASGGGSGTCTSRIGVPSGCGLIFELTPTISGFWTEHVLHNFANDGVDGIEPYSGVTFDSLGNLYGTTFNGGTYDQGTVFEMLPNGSGWNEEVLYSFGATSGDGMQPDASLLFDADGNLYGETFDGGIQNAGTIFELRRRSGGSWSEALLYQFGRRFGLGNPGGGLEFGSDGNLYGTDAYADPYGTGIAFELSPISGGDWQLNVLHEFLSYPGDGLYPNSLVLDPFGKIYCSTNGGGSHDFGAIVEILN
jgi:uncharacterized repeat protein (TIGR03803 family)